MSIESFSLIQQLYIIVICPGARFVSCLRHKRMLECTHTHTHTRRHTKPLDCKVDDCFAPINRLTVLVQLISTTDSSQSATFILSNLTACPELGLQMSPQTQSSVCVYFPTHEE